jgi:hypothetical protein
MAHFAKVNQGQVVYVISYNGDTCDYIDNIAGNWIKCSYNTRCGVHYDPTTGEPSADQSKALRKNFPSSGWIYNEQLDIFSPPQPFASWIVDEQTGLWKAPIDIPNDNKLYKWNEETNNWIETQRIV